MKKIIILLSILCTISAQAQSVFEAARSGDIKAIEEMGKVNLDTADARGFTPLILAVYNNEYEMAAYLLKNGANPNAQDKSGNTALLGTCFKGLPAFTRLLLQNNADVNLANYNDATPLIFAATFGHKEIIEILLANKADKTAKDNRGNSALDHAKMQENEAVISLLN